MRNIIALAGLLAFLCVPAARLEAANCSGRVVNDTNTAAIGGASIQFVPSDPAQSITTVLSAADGTWSCPANLIPGRYFVQANALNYEASAVFYAMTAMPDGSVTEQFGATPAQFNFKLKTMNVSIPPMVGPPAPGSSGGCYDDVAIQIQVAPRKLNGDAWDVDLFGLTGVTYPDLKAILMPIATGRGPCAALKQTDLKPIMLPGDDAGNSCNPGSQETAGNFCRDNVQFRFNGVHLPKLPFHVFLMDVDISQHDMIFEHRDNVFAHQYPILDIVTHRAREQACMYSGGSLVCDLKAGITMMAQISVGPGGKGPCGDQEIVTQYDSTNPKYHVYQPVVNKICDLYVKGCDAAAVWATLKSNVKYAAPTDETGGMANCRVTVVKMTLRNLPTPYASNLIRSVVDETAMSVTNYTKVGHELHPGRVTRRVFQRPDGVYVETTGEGIGDFPGLNAFMADWVWSEADTRLRAGVIRVIFGIP